MTGPTIWRPSLQAVSYCTHTLCPGNLAAIAPHFGRCYPRRLSNTFLQRQAFTVLVVQQPQTAVPSQQGSRLHGALWSMEQDKTVSRQLGVSRALAVGSSAEAAQTLGVEGMSIQLDDSISKRGSSQYLLGKTQEELEELAIALGEQKYRGKQMHQLIYKNKAKNIHEFAQFPVSRASVISTQAVPFEFRSSRLECGSLPVHHVASSKDGTAKLLLRLEDDRLVETVGIPVKDREGASRLTACVSSQVGCALRCAFCATGKGGFSRNLKAHEIVDQVIAIEETFKHRVTNVVFMGMGEPLMNLSAVLPAHRTLNKELLIGQRMMTISTVGVPNTIARLATHKLQSTLAISLHAANQELRSQLVPSAKGYPLEALMEDCQHYFQETGRRISFEYTLLAGVNDQKMHAEELANLLHHWNLGRHVNIIPYNPIADSDFERPTKAKVLAFVETLNNRRVTSSIRVTRGLDANAACGQLRNEFQKFPIQSTLTQ